MNSVPADGPGGHERPGSGVRLSQRKMLGEATAAWLLLAPVLILFSISTIYPLIETIRLSFYDIRGLAPARWVGLENYVTLFADPAFRGTLMTTLVFTFSVTFFSVGLGWTLAMICSFAPKATLPFRVTIFAAFGITEAVSGYIWLGILRPDQAGMLNALIGIFQPGFEYAWLGSVDTAIWCIVIAAVWSGVGLPMMLCFAAVQAIPKSVREAAYIDGAGTLSTMRHILMPLSMPGVRVALFITLLGALRAFDIIYMLTGGGPVRSTETVGYFMFRESMQQFKLGYGAAATVVLMIAILIVSIPAIAQRTKGAS